MRCPMRLRQAHTGGYRDFEIRNPAVRLGFSAALRSRLCQLIRRTEKPHTANKLVQRKLWPILDSLKIPRADFRVFRHAANTQT